MKQSKGPIIKPSKEKGKRKKGPFQFWMSMMFALPIFFLPSFLPFCVPLFLPWGHAYTAGMSGGEKNFKPKNVS